MLVHMVVFKYRSDVGEDARTGHRASLASLAGLDGVVDLQVGGDVVHAGRSYDTGLIVRFTDRAALDAYATNPRHVPVAQLGVSLCEHIVSVDFNA